MNAHTLPEAEAPTAVPHPTEIDMWTVPWMGDERIIVLEHGQFKALHCGGMLRWCRELAVKDCADDIEHQQFLRNIELAKVREQDRRIAKLSPAQFDRVLAAREQELAIRSGNSPAREDMLREDIQIMKDSRARQETRP